MHRRQTRIQWASMNAQETQTGAGTSATQNDLRVVRYGHFQSRDTDAVMFRIRGGSYARFRQIHAIDDSGFPVANICDVRVVDKETEEQTNNRLFAIMRLLELGRQVSAQFA